MEYLLKLPASVPEGKVLVHNLVYPVARKVGTRSEGSIPFTALTDDSRRVACLGAPCGGRSRPTLARPQGFAAHEQGLYLLSS